MGSHVKMVFGIIGTTGTGTLCPPVSFFSPRPVMKHHVDEVVTSS